MNSFVLFDPIQELLLQAQEGRFSGYLSGEAKLLEQEHGRGAGCGEYGR